MDHSRFTPEGLRSAAPLMFAAARGESSLGNMRRRLCDLAEQMEYATFHDYGELEQGSIIRVRDCAMALRSMLSRRSDDLAGFSVARALRDLSRGVARPDLTPAFYADLHHLLLGLQGKGPGEAPADAALDVSELSGREAAVERSRQLDALWERIEGRLAGYRSGLDEDVVRERGERRRRILEGLGEDVSEYQTIWYYY